MTHGGTLSVHGVAANTLLYQSRCCGGHKELFGILWGGGAAGACWYRLRGAKRQAHGEVVLYIQ